MIDTQQYNTSSADTQGDDDEPDMEPSSDEQPQDQNHPNITRPQKISRPSNSETTAALGLLGGGQPYRNMNN